MCIITEEVKLCFILLGNNTHNPALFGVNDLFFAALMHTFQPDELLYLVWHKIPRVVIAVFYPQMLNAPKLNFQNTGELNFRTTTVAICHYQNITGHCEILGYQTHIHTSRI